MENKTALKILRESKGETLSSIARYLNIGVSRYYLIEVGERPATPIIAEKLAKKLGVKIEDIFLPQSFTVRKINKEMASHAINQ
ncbi:helix-turn-helix domain-containing protein [Neomoorella thermoacetica]|uniref:helix-turn-helix domain-containing protein n=1 Tax=Neomoorella thermoacetica TaxID=1525 RepID=UPI0008FB080F|nr:helix-turn-helix transcriptional regulator [Moorella thermoacetica]OIQ53391.1 helix-turn-helix domain protein [Moorella thermoacetica]